ncbi:hypothetical protein BB558_000852 [Smittium angustum]|uniref:Dolichyl-phosphate-mannose--protein mannosyltransferase n=1 Tax=Smittium angustum TaxID=133377 RepID=A0A2U1JD22_SMIAN|nr:hypothetical protein BB558_000852 [Smittium angustum]
MSSEKVRSRKQQRYYMNSEFNSASQHGSDYDFNENEKYNLANPSNDLDYVPAYQKDHAVFQSTHLNQAKLADPTSGKRFRFTKKRLIVLGLVFLMAAYFRLWKLSHPSKVVFDEVHFGKHAGLYINRTFFLDVHPPLAKMMFAAAGKIFGYDGKFDFKTIGLDYTSTNVPYASMRFMPAFLGLAMVPITYITIAAFGGSEEACLLGSFLVTFENSFMTISRLILLDSILIFFTGLTVMFWALFLREEGHPFTKTWWVYLILTGVNMGNALSSKWVGLFLVGTIGVWTIKDLWFRITDYRVTLNEVNKHFWARVLGLIVTPLTVYVFWFYIHFSVLTLSGSGNNFMSPEFQTTVGGSHLVSTMRDVYYGSKIRIRHDATNAGYLHSHASRYETGSKQQQVTLYSHRDDNNYWIIDYTLDQKKKLANSTNLNELKPIKNGDVIRLKHANTKKNLHSHNLRAPVTNKDYINEVSGYGGDDFDGDSNDDWIVRIMDGDNSVPSSFNQIVSIHSKFRLIHKNEKCALFSNRVKLPKWGFEQVEVVCMKHAKYPKSIWRIESATHEKINYDTAPKVSFKIPGFFEKFIESHVVMLRVNNGLTGSHFYDSRPFSWIYLRRGIGYWSEKGHTIYLIGNPIIWWLAFVSIVSFVAIQLVLVLRDQRGYNDQMFGYRAQYMNFTGFFGIGWAMHYFPFFLMGRQLFLHHYLPALWFGIVALASSIDIFTRKVSSKARTVIMCALLFYTLRLYFLYSPVGYGTSWTREACEKSKMLSSWDFSCKQYPSIAEKLAKQTFDKDQGKKDNEKIQEAEIVDPGQPQPIDNIDEEIRLNQPAPMINDEDKKKLESDWEKFKNEDVKGSASLQPEKKDGESNPENKNDKQDDKAGEIQNKEEKKEEQKQEEQKKEEQKKEEQKQEEPKKEEKKEEEQKKEEQKENQQVIDKKAEEPKVENENQVAKDKPAPAEPKP